MPKFSGLFSCFFEIDDIEIDKIASSIGFKGDPKLLENKLGNQILYPQTIPVSKDDLIFNLGLLQEALRFSGQKLYNQNLKRLYIPEKLLEVFTDRKNLVLVFINVFMPFGLITVSCKSALGVKNLGTLIRPTILGSGNITLWVKEKKYQIKAGILTIIPSESDRVDIKFESSEATLEDENTLMAEVAGGQLGLVIDARRT